MNDGPATLTEILDLFGNADRVDDDELDGLRVVDIHDALVERSSKPSAAGLPVQSLPCELRRLATA